MEEYYCLEGLQGSHLNEWHWQRFSKQNAKQIERNTKVNSDFLEKCALQPEVEETVNPSHFLRHTFCVTPIV